MPTLADQHAWVLEALDHFELPLLRYALRLLGDEASARDAVQHAFLRLCDQSQPEALARKENLADASGWDERRLAAWLFAVVRNRATDLLRQRGRTLEFDDAFDPAGSNDDDPADIIERDDLLALVRRLIDELPPAQSEAMALWSEGFSYAEIAEITGRGEGNLRVLVHRALTWLKQHPAIEAATEGRQKAEVRRQK